MTPSRSKWNNWGEIFLVALKMGSTSFGGPSAHIGFFHREYVRKRAWVDDQEFAGLVALSQALPGPSSSQVGIALGTIRGGGIGGFLAWLGFTLPSTLLLVSFAALLKTFPGGLDPWIHGLKLTAVAVVFHAVLGMAKLFVTDYKRLLMAVSAMAAFLFVSVPWVQLAVLAVAAVAGGVFLKGQSKPATSKAPSWKVPIILLGSLGVLLLFSPLLRLFFPGPYTTLADIFFRTGSLVFGGGHVVLPLLEREILPLGWVSKESFLAGYGAAQAIPGPLFTFSAYLGFLVQGWGGAIVALCSIFLPSFLMLFALLPLWRALPKNSHVEGILSGLNASVVGLLFAVLVNPLGISTLLSPLDFVLAIGLFALLRWTKLPPWCVVLVGTALSVVFSYLDTR